MNKRCKAEQTNLISGVHRCQLEKDHKGLHRYEIGVVVWSDDD